MSSFLDKTGLTKLWNLIKSYIDKNHPKYEILGNVDAPDIEIETPNLPGGGSTGGNYYIMPEDFIIALMTQVSNSTASSITLEYQFSAEDWNNFYSKCKYEMKTTEFVFDFWPFLMSSGSEELPEGTIGSFCGFTLFKGFVGSYLSDNTELIMFDIFAIEATLVIKIIINKENDSYMIMVTPQQTDTPNSSN